MTRPTIAEEPVTRTIRDCAGCPKVSRCDSHITGGTHRHQDSGCRPVIDADLMDSITKRLLDADPETISLFGGRHHLTQQQTEILKLTEEELVKKIIDSDQENARIINSGHYHPKAVL